MLGLVYSSIWFGQIANVLDKMFKVQEAKDEESEPSPEHIRRRKSTKILVI